MKIIKASNNKILASYNNNSFVTATTIYTPDDFILESNGWKEFESKEQAKDFFGINENNDIDLNS